MLGVVAGGFEMGSLSCHSSCPRGRFGTEGQRRRGTEIAVEIETERDGDSFSTGRNVWFDLYENEAHYVSYV